MCGLLLVHSSIDAVERIDQMCVEYSPFVNAHTLRYSRTFAIIKRGGIYHLTKNTPNLVNPRHPV